MEEGCCYQVQTAHLFAKLTVLVAGVHRHAVPAAAGCAAAGRCFAVAAKCTGELQGGWARGKAARREVIYIQHVH
jgi:hypothetical protein